MKIESRPWTPQDLIDDLQDIINEESKEYLNTRRTTLEMALAYLKEHFAEQNWIPVTERLPNHLETVLCYTNFGEVRLWQWNEKWKTWTGAIADYGKNVVTHWMPLPEPPEEEHNE